MLVSDELQAAKPSVEAFAPVIEIMQSHQVTFVDDNIRNIVTARSLGMKAVLADASINWSAIEI